MKRFFFVSLGVGTAGLAVLGVYVPGLPTTPFVIVALWAFSASSPRLHTWFRRIPILAPAIRIADQFYKEKTIPRGVKVTSQLCAWLSFLGVFLFSSLGTIGLSVVFVAALSCTIAMMVIPTRKDHTDTPLL